MFAGPPVAEPRPPVAEPRPPVAEPKFLKPKPKIRGEGCRLQTCYRSTQVPCAVAQESSAKTLAVRLTSLEDRDFWLVERRRVMMPYWVGAADVAAPAPVPGDRRC